MAGSSNRPGEAITGINVTPFVDVMLVLLIIFMVTANQINRKVIEVELPKAATGDSMEKDLNLGFVITSDSVYYLDGVEFDLTELNDLVKKKIAENPDSKLQALIGADKEAKHGAVVDLIDQLRIQGIFDFALNIESKN